MRRTLPAFDVLVDMARNEPDRLEKLRCQLTKHVINGAESEEKRRRLEGVQFRIDMERRRAGSPLAATIRISEMMCHSLADLHKSMVTPLAEELPEPACPPQANVLKFPSTVPAIIDE